MVLRSVAVTNLKRAARAQRRGPRQVRVGLGTPRVGQSRRLRHPGGTRTLIRETPQRVSFQFDHFFTPGRTTFASQNRSAKSIGRIVFRPRKKRKIARVPPVSRADVFQPNVEHAPPIALTWKSRVSQETSACPAFLPSQQPGADVLQQPTAASWKPRVSMGP